MPAEIWRAVPTWEGYYEASNLGQVRSVARHNGKRTIKQKILKFKEREDGYWMVRLQNRERQEQLKVHRIIALTFLAPPSDPEFSQVCHMDGKKKNNVYTNLEWGTPSKNGLDRSRLGENKRHCLTPDDLRQIRASTKSMTAIALRFGISASHARSIRRDGNCTPRRVQGKPVITPSGQFDSLADAGRAHGLTIQQVRQRLTAKKHHEWQYAVTAQG